MSRHGVGVGRDVRLETTIFVVRLFPFPPARPHRNPPRGQAPETPNASRFARRGLAFARSRKTWSTKRRPVALVVGRKTSSIAQRLSNVSRGEAAPRRPQKSWMTRINASHGSPNPRNPTWRGQAPVAVQVRVVARRVRRSPQKTRPGARCGSGQSCRATRPAQPKTETKP